MKEHLKRTLANRKVFCKYLSVAFLLGLFNKLQLSTSKFVENINRFKIAQHVPDSAYLVAILYRLCSMVITRTETSVAEI